MSERKYPDECFKVPSSSSPGAELEYRYYGESGLCTLSNDHAHIDYYPDPKTKSWRIQDMKSQKQGSMKSLLQDWVVIMDCETAVTAPIIEENTKEKLHEWGYEEHVLNTGQTIEISSPETLGQLKIARVFQGGGITTDLIRLYACIEKDEVTCQIEYIGRIKY